MTNPFLDSKEQILFLNAQLLKKDAELAEYIAENEQYAQSNDKLQEAVLELEAENEQLSNQVFDVLSRANSIQRAAEERNLETGDIERRLAVQDGNYEHLLAEYDLLRGEYDVLRVKGEMLLEERNHAIADCEDRESEFAKLQEQVMEYENGHCDTARQLEENRELICAQSAQIVELNEDLIAKQRQLEVLKLELQSQQHAGDSELERDNERLINVNMQMKSQILALHEQLNKRTRLLVSPGVGKARTAKPQNQVGEESTQIGNTTEGGSKCAVLQDEQRIEVQNSENISEKTESQAEIPQNRNIPTHQSESVETNSHGANADDEFDLAKSESDQVISEKNEYSQLIDDFEP